MEPARYIISILMITSTNASSNENAVPNISGLNNFNQMIDKLIAETESTVTVPVIEDKSGTEASTEKDNGQGVTLPNEKDAELALDVEHNKGSTIDRNWDPYTKDLNVKRNNSKIIYINNRLPNNVTLDEKIENAHNSRDDLPEFFKSRRSLGDNAKYDEFFKKFFDKTQGEDHGRGVVVKEEFSFEIEDDKPIPALKSRERNHHNNTFYKMFVPPVVAFQGDHAHNVHFTLPPVRTPTHKNEEIGVRNGKPPLTEKVMMPNMPIPNYPDNSFKLITELSKINAKINDVEDLLKKSIVNEKQVPNMLKLVHNPELVNSESNAGLKNPQGVAPYEHAIYQPAVPNIAASSVLSLQERLIEEKARNHLLNLKLEKIARAKQNVALLNELIRARSRLILHLPTVYQRFLL